MNPLFTDIPGIRVGQAEDEAALTGCTIILCPEGAVAGVDQRGGAPGTRETDLLRPMHLVERVHGAADVGQDFRRARVPIPPDHFHRAVHAKLFFPEYHNKSL